MEQCTITMVHNKEDKLWEARYAPNSNPGGDVQFVGLAGTPELALIQMMAEVDEYTE